MKLYKKIIDSYESGNKFNEEIKQGKHFVVINNHGRMTISIGHRYYRNIDDVHFETRVKVMAFGGNPGVYYIVSTNILNTKYNNLKYNTEYTKDLFTKYTPNMFETQPTLKKNDEIKLTNNAINTLRSLQWSI
jgi:hypothetical protein